MFTRESFHDALSVHIIPVMVSLWFGPRSTGGCSRLLSARLSSLFGSAQLGDMFGLARRACWAWRGSGQNRECAPFTNKLQDERRNYAIVYLFLNIITTGSMYDYGLTRCPVRDKARRHGSAQACGIGCILGCMFGLVAIIGAWVVCWIAFGVSSFCLFALVASWVAYL